MSVDRVHTHIRVLMTSSVHYSIEQVLERDPSNVGVLQFLDSLEQWVAGQQGVPSQGLTADWIAMQRTKRFSALKKPQKDEHKSLTALAIKCGGIGFLENQ